MEENRIALIGIIVEDITVTDRLNTLLTEYGDHIVGRMGVPYRSKGICIISVIVDATNDIISALSGKLGMIKGLNIKTVYAKTKGDMITMKQTIIDKLVNSQSATADELAYLLELDDFLDIYAAADGVRKIVHGDTVHIRAIIEFSDYCSRRCAYCGLNAENSNVHRYRMKPEDIIQTAVEAYRAGYLTVVLQSGEDGWFTPKILGEIVKSIRAQTDMKITLSCGEMSYEDYKYLRECGADKYLLKHETADMEIYAALHPDARLESRINCLMNIKQLGYETGSGFMIGLPGQTTRTIAKDILLLKELRCDMAGIGPFIPHPDTPLRDHLHGSIELTKRAVALTRLILPHCNLPATTALGVLSKDAKDDILSCGANVIMRKVTPPDYRQMYEIYPVDFGEAKDIVTERRELEAQIRSVGREPK